jgi:hypothetical protein
MPGKKSSGRIGRPPHPNSIPYTPGSSMNILTAFARQVSVLQNKLKTWLAEIHAAIKSRDEQLLQQLAQKIEQQRNSLTHLADEERQTVGLELIDAYLTEYRLGRWQITENSGDLTRDQLLGYSNAQILYNKKISILTSVSKIILLFLPQFLVCSENHKQLYDELQKYYQLQVQQTGRYYTLDCSDDSDLDDEAILEQRPVTRSQGKYHKLKRLQGHHNPVFWKTTRRTTEKNKGLVDKLSGLDPDIISSRNMLTRGLLKRAILPPVPALPAAKEFVAFFRGNNYMSDRWSTAARRAHYAAETDYAGYSEAALHAGLPHDVYTETKPEMLAQLNPEFHAELKHVSQLIKNNYAELLKTGAVVADTVSPTHVAPYLFNHVGDQMQHEFSNGINRHLLTIKKRLQDDYWQSYFISAYNYALATGNRPYHSLKYALGLKDYYPDAFSLRYHADGRLDNCHAGKIYIVLLEKHQFLAMPSVSRVIQKNYQGQCPIGQRILPELETSFIGEIPAEYIVYQQPLKFPSFHYQWHEFMQVAEIKYGFNQALYESFQSLITQTSLDSNERKTVLELLKEWLCAYYEVLLLNIAIEEAKRREGELIYINHEDQSVTEPDKNPKTNGDINLVMRSRVIILEKTRYQLAQRYPNPEGVNIRVV